MASELLTWAEIERRYDGEWVLLGDVQYITDDPAEVEIAHARVLEHTDDHEDLWRRADRRPPESGAMLFIGEPSPTDVVYIL
jgi:hypothetical protein